MTISTDQQWRLHKACLHDEDVRIALVGFLVAHFHKIGVEIDPEIFDEAIGGFALAMANPEIITRCVAVVAAVRAERQAAAAERRTKMN